MIVVTGDSGFIGSNLTKVLSENGYQLRGIDINPVKKYSVSYPYVIGNILDRKIVESTIAGADCIIHLAAAHKDFGITKEEYFRTNVEGIRVLLQCATEYKIKKFIFYSSVSIYGNNQPSTEESTPKPINFYGESKLEAENELKSWALEEPSREVIIIRPAVVFGPSNVANIFKLIKQVCDGTFYWVGDGNNVKSIAYVENLVEATLFLLNNMKKGCQIFNYSDEPHLTTRELVTIIAKIAGVSVPKVKIPLRLAINVAKVADILGAITKYDLPVTSARLIKFNTATEHRAQKIRETGFRPSHTIEEGLEKNVKWYRESYKHSKVNFEANSE